MGDARGTGRRHRHGRFVALAAAGLMATSLVATACGLGDKAALEERITSAPARFDDQVVGGTISIESRFVSAPAGGGVGGFGAPSGPTTVAVPEDGFVIGDASRTFLLDLGGSRAALSEGAAGPSVIFDDLVLYGRRSGIPDDDARPWVRLDLADVGEGAGELQPFSGSGATAVVALHPALAVDLAAGTLTGSIETIGTEDLGGVPTTHYSVNISIEKALEDVRRSRYPEDRRELAERLVELLGVDGDVHRADVWLDDAGDLRRFSVALTQRPATKVEFALVVTVDVTTVGGTYDPSPPTPDEVLSVDSVVRFITTVTGGAAEGDTEIPASIAATLGTVPADDPTRAAESDEPATPNTPDVPQGGDA